MPRRGISKVDFFVHGCFRVPGSLRYTLSDIEDAVAGQGCEAHNSSELSKASKGRDSAFVAVLCVLCFRGTRRADLPQLAQAAKLGAAKAILTEP